jgi:hypothetical protein
MRCTNVISRERPPAVVDAAGPACVVIGSSARADGRHLPTVGLDPS